MLKGMALRSPQETSHPGPVLECQGKQQSIGVKRAKILHQTLSLQTSRGEHFAQFLLSLVCVCVYGVGFKGMSVVKGKLSRASSLFPTLHESWGIELRSLGLRGTRLYSVSHLGPFLSSPMPALILQIPLPSADSFSTVHIACLATKKWRK